MTTSFGRDTAFAVSGASELMQPWQAVSPPPFVNVALWFERSYTPRPATIRLVGHVRGSWGHLLRIEFWTIQGDFLVVNYAPGEHLVWPGSWDEWLVINASVYRYTGALEPLQRYLQSIITP